MPQNNVIHQLNFGVVKYGPTTPVEENQPFRFDTVVEKFDSTQFTFDEN